MEKKGNLVVQILYLYSWLYFRTNEIEQKFDREDLSIGKKSWSWQLVRILGTIPLQHWKFPEK